MPHKNRTTKTEPNVPGSVTTTEEVQQEAHKREDFFRDLKKVIKKLPPDHPSRSGSEKR